MYSPNQSEKFYSQLKAQLYKTTSWPSKYMFKFIIKSDQDKISKIETAFDNMGAIITSSASKNGKYTSISILVKMINPEAVIEKYLLIGKEVKDVISL